MRFFVSGGSRGLGRAIVLAAREAGHDVAFMFRTRRDAAEEVARIGADLGGGGVCRAYELDVRDADAVDAVADRVAEDLGGVEVVVSNAGCTRDALAVSMSDEAWREVLDTNLTGGFHVARAFLPLMLAAGFGRLVFVGSVAQHGIAGQANYAAAKAGLGGLTRALAKEYGPKRITANLVVPGFFDTDMTRASMAPRLRAFWDELCPVGRMGETRELAHAVMFLASAEASFVNGQTLGVTGGLDWAS